MENDKMDINSEQFTIKLIEDWDESLIIGQDIILSKPFPEGDGFSYYLTPISNKGINYLNKLKEKLGY